MLMAIKKISTIASVAPFLPDFVVGAGVIVVFAGWSVFVWSVDALARVVLKNHISI